MGEILIQEKILRTRRVYGIGAIICPPAYPQFSLIVAILSLGAIKNTGLPLTTVPSLELWFLSRRSTLSVYLIISGEADCQYFFLLLTPCFRSCISGKCILEVWTAFLYPDPNYRVESLP